MPFAYQQTYEFPVPLDDVAAVEAIVRREELLCAVNCDAEHDPYRCMTWRRLHASQGTELFVLLDRNAFNDVLYLARPAAEGQEVACDPRGKVGAALMAFLQCSNARIEPVMALSENPGRAPEELVLFRRADNVAAQVYFDIALGRLTHLPAWKLPLNHSVIPNVDFRQAIQGRRTLTIAMLKVANLDLADLPPAEKMAAYLRWSHAEFLFLNPVILFACAHFTRRREKALLKDIRSADRQRALVGVGNAVWDMHMLVEWNRSVSRQRTDNRLWVFCTRDRALKAVARAMHRDGRVDDPSGNGLRAFFKQYWSMQEANRLVDLTLELQADEHNPLRQANLPMDSRYLDGLAASLEASLLAWRP